MLSVVMNTNFVQISVNFLQISLNFLYAIPFCCRWWATLKQYWILFQKHIFVDVTSQQNQNSTATTFFYDKSRKNLFEITWGHLPFFCHVCNDKCYNANTQKNFCKWPLSFTNPKQNFSFSNFQLVTLNFKN